MFVSRNIHMGCPACASGRISWRTCRLPQCGQLPRATPSEGALLSSSQSVDEAEVKPHPRSSEDSLDGVEVSSVVSASSDVSKPLWFVDAYMRSLENRPILTKCFTSLSGFLIGDIVAQLLTENTYDVSRTAILAGYGFFIDAPAGHTFYNWLDANIEPGAPKTAKAVFKKIAIDQLIYAPVFTCVLYAYLESMHGDFSGIPAALQEKVLPTLAANYAVWPAAHSLNFYYVPTEQRILYNNFVAVCWTTWLSCLAH